MKKKETYDFADNRSVLKKAYKSLLEKTEGICGYCPFNRCRTENPKRKVKRNWKRFRKTQWR